LDFDNTAFNYFALTLLCFYLVPTIWFLLKEVYGALGLEHDPNMIARTEVEAGKVAQLRAKRTGMARLQTSKVMWSVVGGTVALACGAYLLSQVGESSEMAAFDPFAILGVEPGTDEKLIKKAYRKLSLKYHPDKNVGDKVAEEMFMKLAKAHDSLLDPVSKENYEKYGSPDGKQALEVSIGLPSIILENPKIFLLIYLVVMVAVIPISVQVWYANSKLYAERNILLDTYKGFQYLMKKDKKMSKIAEVLAISAEFRRINEVMSFAYYTSDNNEIMSHLPQPVQALVVNAKPPLAKLKDKMKSGRLMVQPEKLTEIYRDSPKKSQILSNQVLLGNLLLHSHLNRERLGTTVDAERVLNDNLDRMLATLPDILQALIDFCKTAYFLDAIVECVKFSQCMNQAIWTHVGDSPFVQLSPKLKKGKGATALEEAVKDIPNLLKMSDEECLRKVAGQSDEVRRDIMEARKVLPKMTLETRVFVVEDDDSVLAAFHEEEEEERQKGDDVNADADESNESKGKGGVVVDDVSDDEGGNDTAVVPAPPISGEDVFEGDLVRLRVTLTRENVPEGERAGAVYAPFYPSVLEEAWWLLLLHPRTGQVLAADRLTDQDRVIKSDMRFMAPNETGEHDMDLMVMRKGHWE